MEATQPNIFHIHIDARNMPKALDSYAIKELGFTVTDYEGHPEGYDHFEPNRHLTLKIQTREEFKKKWEILKKKIEEFPDFVGYIEGEYIPIDEFIPFKEYSDLPIPFYVTRRKLNAENSEEFRQTEIHLTLEKHKSHPELIKKLLDSGLYGAFIPKKDDEFLVLTIQGFINDIVPLVKCLKKFVATSGGANRCTIKEERALSHELFGITSSELPEIADKITYFDKEKY